MRRLALRSALSSSSEQQLLVLEGLEIAAPRTKEMVALLATLGVDGKAMIVLPEMDQTVSAGSQERARASNGDSQHA